MDRIEPGRALAFLVAVLVVLGGMGAAKGGLYISTHEGDTLHLLDILTRMAEGQRIHRDFETPLGILGFAPILLFVKAGWGIGHALVYAQILVALVLLPATWWLLVSRLGGWVAYLTGAYVMILALALSYGGTKPILSMSMHYNRWAWALAYIAVLLAALPARRGRPAGAMDGVVIGLAVAALSLIKVTYFVAFAPAIALILVIRRAWTAIAVAVVAGIVVAAVVTVFAGVDFWAAYLGDIRAVAQSEYRPKPGLALDQILGSPEFLGLNIVLLAGIVFFRQTARREVGLILMLLAPGFIYVTYQNYGNDPQWALLLVVLIATLRPAADEGGRRGPMIGRAFDMLVAAGLAFAAASLLNLAYSPYRHLAEKTADYVPLVPADPRNDDLRSPRRRAERLDATIAIDTPEWGLEAFHDRVDRSALLTINGEEVPYCELQGGIGALYATTAADLAATGYAGKGIYEIDILAALPLYGPLRALRGGAPWYYGGTPGLADADYVLLPACPIEPKARKLKYDALLAAGYTLTEVRRTPTYRLFSIAGAPAASGGS